MPAPTQQLPFSVTPVPGDLKLHVTGAQTYMKAKITIHKTIIILIIIIFFKSKAMRTAKSTEVKA